MPNSNPACPKCHSENTYLDGALWMCPECYHEWTPDESKPQASESVHETLAPTYLDANGTPLKDGDTVQTVKDLKVGKETIKSGTKVKNIRLLDEPVDGHDISCKIPEHGSMYLKCSVVKKVNG